MKYIASVSFGKDSLAMLLNLIERDYPLDIVVFYNTGMEFECIYTIRDQVINILKKYNIEYVELAPKEPFLYSMLERKVYSKQKGEHFGYGWCGGLCRWGTTSKLKSIKDFKKSLNTEVIDYVGIAADEPLRFEKAKSEGKVLPLVEWQMTEKDCLNYCYNKGFYWYEQTSSGVIDLYNVLSRVSCWCCCNKNLQELKNIYNYMPEYWNKLKDLQSKIERPFKGFYKGNPRGIFELEKRFKNENINSNHIDK